MLTHTYDTPHGPVVCVGLTAEDLRLLGSNRPLTVNLATQGFPTGKVFLFVAETAADLQRALSPGTAAATPHRPTRRRTAVGA